MKYHLNAENLLRIMKGIRPYGAIIFQKFWSSEVPCSIPVPVKVKFGAEPCTSNFTWKTIHTCICDICL